MPLPILINLANPDPSANPLTLQELVDVLRPLLSGEVTGNYVAYVQGNATPAVEDQDKIWHRTDVGGRPLGTFKFYDGAWRRQYSGLGQEYRLFKGDPAVHFDGTGRGLVGGTWDGWALCNGQNGTRDWRDKFIVCGRTYVPAAWSSEVGGVQAFSGGAAEHLITADDLPPLDIDIVGLKLDQGGQPNFAESKIIVDDDYIPGTEETVNMGHYGAADAGSQTAVPTLPPWFAAALCEFVGYS